MALPIVSAIAAVMLFYFAYRNWHIEQFSAVVSGAIGVLILVCLMAIYVAEREPMAAIDTLPPPAPAKMR